MLEQGDFAEKIHTDIGKLVKENNIDMLVAIGESSKYIIAASGTGVHFDNAEQAAEKIGDIIAKGDTVLFKASRGMHLEIVCDKVKTIWKDI